MQQGQGPSVLIAADAGFTHLWLLPRLPALKRAFPEYTIRLMPIERADYRSRGLLSNSISAPAPREKRTS
ncbi:hypothetical protein [Halomonas borealis]|jgi:DNA-binding transcriptional LysR family regulator|uniref:hypothetical protein n=1 Tax=Halomonas borealis TaxID=2508710 RepID=UPI001F0FAD1D|nr:hypothetical protein [Halomonas borealis]